MEVRFVGVVLHHREMAWKGRSVPVMRSSCSSRAGGWPANYTRCLWILVGILSDIKYLLLERALWINCWI